MKKTQEIIKKYFTYLTFGLAIGFFLAAGVSLTFSKQAGITKRVTHQIVHKESPTATPTVIPTQNNSQQVIPTNTPIPAQSQQPNKNPASNMAAAMVTPTPAPQQQTQQTVNVQVVDPAGTSSFQVALHNGDNLCDNLTEAKQEGKIKSLTLQWYASFNSYYVYEMNGYTNNWTFIYQHSDHGCSYYHPNAGETIVWKFS